MDRKTQSTSCMKYNKQQKHAPHLLYMLTQTSHLVNGTETVQFLIKLKDVNISSGHSFIYLFVKINMFFHPYLGYD